MDMNRGVKQDERGIAAIAVATIMMIVISIIVLGFSQAVRREERNALDNQLSTQAYYAAESGVNLVQEKVRTLTGPIEKTDCAPDSNFNDYAIGENAKITCLLVNNKVPSLEYQAVSTNSVPAHVKVESGVVDALNISWQSASNPSSTSGCGSTVPSMAFPESWTCAQPLLRVDLVPLPAGGGSVTAEQVRTSQYTLFLYPVSGTSSVISYQAGNDSGAKGDVKGVRCDATLAPPQKPKLCTAEITNLNSQAYAVRIMSIYGQSDVQILAPTTTGTKTLIEGQVEVDSTARAADVIKRVRARLPIASSLVPDFALLSGNGICKRYQISGSTVEIADPSTHPACAL